MSIKELLPDGPAWEGKTSGQMGKFLDGLDEEYERLIEKCLKITNDFFPDTTTVPERWESAFSLPQGIGLTLEQRRARLESRWRILSTGTMQPEIMEEIFALSGFSDVRVRVLRPYEDPRPYVVGSGVSVYGRVGAEYGTSAARFGASDADKAIILANPDGFSLEKSYNNSFGSVIWGTDIFGTFDGYYVQPVVYSIPNNQAFWGLLYIIEHVDGSIYEVDGALRDVFLQLAYFMKPLHMWGIARVRFV